MKEKCVIFGAGRYGIVSYELLKEIYDIIGFSDNNEKKWGEKVLNLPVLKPELLLEIDRLTIIIASQWYAAINSQLRKMGLKNIKVFWYKADINIDIIYDESVYVLSELPDTRLFKNCKLDWEHITEIRKDFSKNYNEVTITRQNELKKNNGLKKVLFCAYCFPPIGGPAVQRSLKFVKYLRRYGYEPIVLTVLPDTYYQLPFDQALLNEIESDITIIRISNNVYLPETISNEEQQEIINLYAGIIESEECLNKYIEVAGEIAYPLLSDNSICWVNRCLKYIEDKLDLSEIEILYTTGAPYDTYVLGYYIKYKYDIPWVQDYRDPWCTNKYYIENVWAPWKQSLFFREEMEKELIKKSNIVVVTAEGLIDEFIIKYGVDKSKFIEITNGYDEDDFKNLLVDFQKNQKFTLCYNGHVYIKRNPIPLLCVINELITQGKIKKDKIQWVFNGLVENQLKQLMDKEDRYKIIQYNGYMSHQESIKIAINCDVLILLGETEDGAKVMYPGKTFEYLRMKKPILCFSSKYGMLDKFINKTKTGQNFEYNDCDGMKKYLLYLYEKWEKGENDSIEVNEEEIKKYSRESETKHLAEVFNHVIFEYNKKIWPDKFES